MVKLRKLQIAYADTDYFGAARLSTICSVVLRRIDNTELPHIFLALLWGYLYDNQKYSLAQLYVINPWYCTNKIQEEIYPYV